MMTQLMAVQGNITQAITMTQESLSILQRIGSWETKTVQEILNQPLQMQNP